MYLSLHTMWICIYKNIILDQAECDLHGLLCAKQPKPLLFGGSISLRIYAVLTVTLFLDNGLEPELKQRGKCLLKDNKSMLV